MARLTKKDRHLIRRALLLAVESEDSLSDAYSGYHGANPDEYGRKIQERCANNIAEFRRLLNIFGGPEYPLDAGAEPISLENAMFLAPQKFRAERGSYCEDCPDYKECQRMGCLRFGGA